MKFKIYQQQLAYYPKLLFVPFLLLACGYYGFRSLRMAPEPYIAPPSEKYSDSESFIQWVVSCAKNITIECATSKEVQKEGISFLEKMFKDKIVHDSLIVLLKGGVKDSRFVSDSKTFGIDWIKYTIT
jgi:hypothetical protein